MRPRRSRHAGGSNADALAHDPVLGGVDDQVALADELSGLFSYVAAGLCVSLLPEGARHFSTGGVSFLPLRGDAGYLDTTIQAVHRPDADPTVARLLQVVTGPRSPWA
ncbi:hypothetical protein AB0A77_07455 [Streptomyces varsoviensis]|uniref:hypothetical protein n=1 Tax=Streptomyces varsoviensis TaxID=67373 RepID=UPI0033EE52BE